MQRSDTRGKDPIVDTVLETEVLYTYKRRNKGLRGETEVKCGLFDGSKQGCRRNRVQAERKATKEKRQPKERQPIPSDATRYAIWSSKQDSHKYVCMFQPSGKVSVRLFVLGQDGKRESTEYAVGQAMVAIKEKVNFFLFLSSPFFFFFLGGGIVPFAPAASFDDGKL